MPFEGVLSEPNETEMSDLLTSRERRSLVTQYSLYHGQVSSAWRAYRNTIGCEEGATRPKNDIENSDPVDRAKPNGDLREVEMTLRVIREYGREVK